MNLDNLAPILMIFVRYAISGVGVWLASHGFSDVDASTVTEQLAYIITGSFIAAAPAIYAALVRPSIKAMASAFAIDKSVPADEPVVIKTTVGVADIVIHPVVK
ncbi:hypothetical protein [Mesorhizobium sp. M1322]|uniref:hypothetical protein n=1 Tax=Mesorhizobium sp. M1322 TaxID=2957081 RepID=UPI00333B495D